MYQIISFTDYRVMLGLLKFNNNNWCYVTKISATTTDTITSMTNVKT